MKKEVVAMLLAGGQGSRLYALTSHVAKPAVPFGGKYRIIDFPLSNCVNSGIDTVGVLTQYRPLELNSYIGSGQPWDLDRSDGGVHILPPYMREGDQGTWYKGTANAIYQNIGFLDLYDPEYVIILSGDHIYKMDYTDMLDLHKKSGAACTISVLEVTLEEATRFGIMNVDENDQVYEFEEKPKQPKSNLASMGIYVFTWSKLRRYLIEDDYDSELRFLGKPLPSLYSMDTSGHVIYMNTFARTLAPSLRIGYVVLPPPLAKQFEQDFSFYSSSVPCFEQYTLVHFLQEGYFERHLNRMKKTYRQRQKRLTELLRSHPLGAYLHICGEAAGLHLLLEVQLPCTEQELVQAAAAAHVVVYGLSDYYETPQAVPPTPQIVLGYACLSPEELEQGTMRLLDSWLPFLK